MVIPLNEAKARILVLITQIPEYNRYSRYIAFKLGYTYEYINKQVQELKFHRIIGIEYAHRKGFIRLVQPEYLKLAKEALDGNHPKQTTLKTH